MIHKSRKKLNYRLIPECSVVVWKCKPLYQTGIFPEIKTLCLTSLIKKLTHTCTFGHLQ